MSHSTKLSNENTDDTLGEGNFIVDLISSNLKKLTHDRVYLAKDLIGVDDWDALDTGMKINIGKMISMLADKKLLPISAAGKKTDNKCIYRLD